MGIQMESCTVKLVMQYGMYDVHNIINKNKKEYLGFTIHMHIQCLQIDIVFALVLQDL